MYKIVNSLASAEYDKDLNAVIVKFNGYGELSLYHETMDIAMNIAVIYNSNKWLFAKDFFQDINPYEFLVFVKKWSSTCNSLIDIADRDETCQVAIITTAASKQKLLQSFDWLEEPSLNINNLNLEIFTQLERAYSFLRQKDTLSTALNY